MRETRSNNSKSYRTNGIFLILLATTLLTGCLDFFGSHARKRYDMVKKRDELKNELARSMPLFDERDRLQMELNKCEAQLEALHAAQARMQEGGK
ncbi:MAG: hypothetical protein ACD_39C01966G0002 [uncultured bacterium]|nr:MAG: hypothetical protein ACD_39C01966G0002 [uncultured bacterium]